MAINPAPRTGLLEGLGQMASHPGMLGLAQGYLSGLKPSATPISTLGLLGGGIAGMQSAMKDKNAEDIANRQVDIKEKQFELEQQKATREAQKQEQLSKFMQGGYLGGGHPFENLTEQQRATMGLLGQIDPEKGLEYGVKTSTENEKVDKASPATITANQAIVQSVDDVLPKIESLKGENVPFQAPGPFGIGSAISGTLSPEKQARYESKVSAISDTLVGALGLPKTNESLHLVGKMVRKQFGESDEAYHKRLDELADDLNKKKGAALKVTKGTGEFTTVYKDGIGYRVPNNQLEEALAAGGSLAKE